MCLSGLPFELFDDGVCGLCFHRFSNHIADTHFKITPILALAAVSAFVFEPVAQSAGKQMQLCTEHPYGCHVAGKTDVDQATRPASDD